MPGAPPEAQGSGICQVISFAMYAFFSRLRGSPDRFLNPSENSCRGRLELSRDGLDMRSGFRPAPKLS